MNKQTKNKYLSIFIQACLLIGLAWILTTCKDKETPDPCAGVEKVSAEFVMGQRLIVNRTQENLLNVVIDSLIPSDTVLRGMVYFEATEEGEGITYQWLVGNDQNISTQRRFLLVFQQAMVNVPVRLIIRRPNSTCFAEDADTLVKYLTVIEREDNPIYGTYEGYLLSKPEEVFEVTIGHNIATSDGSTSIGIINIQPGCNPSLTDASAVHGNYNLFYRQMFFVISSAIQFDCLAPRGWAKLDDNNDNLIRITFKQLIDFTNFNAVLQEEFVGIRKID